MGRTGQLSICGLVLLFAGAGAAGCVPKTSCAEYAEEDATVVLGTGTAIYAALENGDDFDVVQGAQGGFHVVGSARFTGIHPGDWENPEHPDNPVLTFEVQGETGVLSKEYRYQRSLKVRSDGQVEVVGELVMMDITSMGQATGQTGVFSVGVEDTCGRSATDVRTVELVPGEVSG